MTEPLTNSIQGSRLFGYTKTQWTIFLILGIVNLLAGLVYSIQAPFYPEEAQKKGASATEFGFVFGIYELTNFIVAPLFGAYMGVIGPIRTFHAGIILTGISTILFGFLDRINGHIPFILLSFLLRVPQAIGATAIITSSVTVVTVEFSTCIATTFAAMETFFGFGFCSGPTIGAFLFELGGFTLPFAILGGLLVAFAPISLIRLYNHDIAKKPTAEELEEEAINNNGTKKGLWNLLKIPAICLSIFATVCTAVSIGFLSTVLEPHLRESFQATPVLTGLFFLLFGGTYALTAPLWGMVCDKQFGGAIVQLIGAIFIMGGFALIGPAPFIPMQPIIWVTGVGLVLFGLGVGGILVSAFILALQDAKHNGYPDTVSTYALVSGIWRSSVALGSFIGPSIAGVLYDEVGFRNESLVVLGLQLILAILVVFSLCHNGGRDRPTPDELRPILDVERTNTHDIRRTLSINSNDCDESSRCN